LRSPALPRLHPRTSAVSFGNLPHNGQSCARALDLPNQRTFYTRTFWGIPGSGPRRLATLGRLVDEINEQVQDEGPKKVEVKPPDEVTKGEEAFRVELRLPAQRSVGPAPGAEPPRAGNAL